jgi:hypothetical protein
MRMTVTQMMVQAAMIQNADSGLDGVGIVLNSFAVEAVAAGLATGAALAFLGLVAFGTEKIETGDGLGR